jgi:16S rRNA (uracil1498-N3)-methyltransferase
LSDAEAHHALHVVRVRIGQRVVVLDGAGHELLCEVIDAGRHHVDLALRQRNDLPRLPFRIALLQAITKAKSMDLIIQKATELGATRIVPILSERSVARPDADDSARKLEKWRAVAIEALKQCGAPWLPQIEAPLTPAAFLAQTPRIPLMLLASLQPGARPPREQLCAAREQRRMPPNDVAVWIGPEGDFTPAELQMIQSAGALPITLGPLVLRSETAALYCLSFLSYELQS